jgi:hypothetical protein
MNWSEEKETAVCSSSKSDNGNWCLYVQLSPLEGVKFYHRADIRDQAANLQRSAAAVGLGPMVGEFCEMPCLASWDMPERWLNAKINPGDKVYGFVTERVFPDYMPQDEYFPFIEKMKNAGISTKDMYNGMNCGRTFDGRAVRFDFDPEFYGKAVPFA